MDESYQSVITRVLDAVCRMAGADYPTMVGCIVAGSLGLKYLLQALAEGYTNSELVRVLGQMNYIGYILFGFCIALLVVNILNLKTQNVRRVFQNLEEFIKRGNMSDLEARQFWRSALQKYHDALSPDFSNREKERNISSGIKQSE